MGAFACGKGVISGGRAPSPSPGLGRGILGPDSPSTPPTPSPDVGAEPEGSPPSADMRGGEEVADPDSEARPGTPAIPGRAPKGAGRSPNPFSGLPPSVEPVGGFGGDGERPCPTGASVLPASEDQEPAERGRRGGREDSCAVGRFGNSFSLPGRGDSGDRPPPALPPIRDDAPRGDFGSGGGGRGGVLPGPVPPEGPSPSPSGTRGRFGGGCSVAMDLVDIGEG